MNNDNVAVIVINGLGGGGKGTFIQKFNQVALNKGYSAWELSTVDFVKQVARFCGWDGEKEQIDRDFLHALKVALTNWRNIPNTKVLLDMKHILNAHQDFKGHFIFVNIREPEYIENFIELCHENGYNNIRVALLVNETKASNEAIDLVEGILHGYKYDDIIVNNGTLEDLQKRAEEYFDLLAKEGLPSGGTPSTEC